MEHVAKRSRTCLSSKKKLEIVMFVEKNPHLSQSEVGRQFGIPQSSVSTILKNKASIVQLATSGKGGVKKNRASNCIALEHGLESFYEACVAKNLLSITYDILIVKGQELGDEMVKRGMIDRKDLPSTDCGWKSYVQRFLAKRNIKSKKTHG